MLGQNSRKKSENSKKIRKLSKFSHFFPNPIKREKYTQNHDRSTILDTKNYKIIEKQ